MAGLSKDKKALGALRSLSGSGDFQTVLNWLKDERERMIKHLAVETETNVVFKLSGNIEIIQALLDLAAEAPDYPAEGKE